MKQATSTDSQHSTVLIATQGATDATSSNAQLAISADLGLIALGLVLLGTSCYMFMVKICKTLASSGNK